MSGKTTSVRRLCCAALLPLALGGCLEQQARPTGGTPVERGVRQALAAPMEPTSHIMAASHWLLPDHAAAICSAPPDLWDRIRAGMNLPDHEHPGVQSDLDWYAGNQEYLDRVVERAQPYLHMIVEAVERHGLPTEIALLPVVESAFQPFAYSHGRAAGLWQFIPDTGRRFDLKQSWWYDGRRDVAAATEAALTYLERLRDQFEGDWLLALAAYNAGEGNVQRAVERNRQAGKPTDFWSLDLPRETRGYVPKLLAIARLIKHPQQFDVALQSIADEPVLGKVKLDSQIDLTLAAELAGISVEDVYLYNPGFNRWATDPDGPHQLLLPLEQVAQFKQRLAELPPQQRLRWERHTVRSGESLLTLAKQYRTTVELIRDVNKLPGNVIRAGNTLTIPVARQSLESYPLSVEQRVLATQNQPRAGRHKQEYQVRAGDTLWTIARRFGVDSRDLAKWNAMAPRDPLLPGRKLVIWTANTTSTLASSNPAEFTHPVGDTTIRRIGYTVRRGDSLAAISQRFQVSVDNLVKWNQLDDGKYLQPGQRLTLFVDVTRQSDNI